MRDELNFLNVKPSRAMVFSDLHKQDVINAVRVMDTFPHLSEWISSTNPGFTPANMALWFKQVDNPEAQTLLEAATTTILSKFSEYVLNGFKF